MFNAFKYSKQLESAGFSREQAEIQLQVITEIVEGELATKQDLQNLGTAISHDAKATESNLRKDIEALRHEMKTGESSLRQEIELIRIDMKTLENRLTIKLGTFLIIGITAMTTIMKFLLIK